MERYATIIEQLPLEQQLSIQQDQFRGAFKTAAIGMAIVGLDGKWLEVNESLLNIIGYNKEELYQLTFQDITHPDDLHADLALVKQLLDGKKDSYRLEKRYYHRNGEIIWVILSVSVVRDTNGISMHFVSQIIDITEIKKITHLQLAETDKQSSRIALELHENIARTLGDIQMYLNSSLAAQIYKDRDLAGVDKQLSSLILEIKGLTTNIMPTTLLTGDLMTVIDDLVLKYHVQHRLLIHMCLGESLQDIRFPMSYHIYRIIENQLKLALLRNASRLRLKISRSRLLHIDIEADGQPSNLFASQEELLLSDIKTRTEILDGVFSHGTGKNIVHQYAVSIPITRASSSTLNEL